MVSGERYFRVADARVETVAPGGGVGRVGRSRGMPLAGSARWSTYTLIVLIATGSDVGCASSNAPEPVQGRSESGDAAWAPPPDDAATSALAVYTGMWRTWVLAARTSDSTHPELSRYARGEALRKLAVALGYNHDRGWVSRGEPVLQPRIEGISQSGKSKTVWISDCVDTSNWRTETTTGEAAGDDVGGRRAVRAEARFDYDGWRVDDFNLWGVDSC